MSAVVETMNYETLKDFLSTICSNDELFKIFSYLNGQGFCRISADDLLIYIENVGCSQYGISLLDT